MTQTSLGRIALSRFLILPLIGFAVGGCGTSTPEIPEDPPLYSAYHAIAKLESAKNDSERFIYLIDAAKDSFRAANLPDASMYANELLSMLPKNKGSFAYGNAVHDGNMVLGRVALKEGRLEDAKKYLLEAGRTPGSPQLDSFGPNMSLAKDLLEAGERDVVLEYFDRCRKFWKDGRLDRWEEDVRAGKIPRFGNLNY